MQDSMKVPAPPSIRRKWLEGGSDRTILDSTGTVLVSYDPSTSTGGIYRIEAGMWVLMGPMTLAEFGTALHQSGTRLPDVHDLQLWLDAVSATDVPEGMTPQ